MAVSNAEDGGAPVTGELLPQLIIVEWPDPQHHRRRAAADLSERRAEGGIRIRSVGSIGSDHAAASRHEPPRRGKAGRPGSRSAEWMSSSSRMTGVVVVARCSTSTRRSKSRVWTNVASVEKAGLLPGGSPSSGSTRARTVRSGPTSASSWLASRPWTKARKASTTATYAGPASPRSRHDPAATRAPRATARSFHAWRRRVLPTPASPPIRIVRVPLLGVVEGLIEECKLRETPDEGRAGDTHHGRIIGFVRRSADVRGLQVRSWPSPPRSRRKRSISEIRSSPDGSRSSSTIASRRST